jgi:hypothetical protein
MERKKIQVLIGEKEFNIVELTCMKRNALLDIVGQFTFAEILKSVMPLLKELGVDLSNEENDDKQIGSLIQLGLENEAIWGGLMACLVSVLRIGPQVISLSLEKLDEKDENYITEHLTITQEPVILKQIIELNKLPETVKNYKSLLADVRSLTTS